MPIYSEQNFEEHIEEHLLASGYHARPPQDFDRALCLLPAEVITFLQQTQSLEYEKLQQQYGSQVQTKLCQRLSQEIHKRGTLDVLRKGIKDRGARLQLAYFQPASGMNPEHRQLYQANRFAVVRQLKYSQKNENSIDMALFLNGIPIVTAELKNSLTGQFVGDAIMQYKKDRDPKGEPLLAFKRCLVHFAVGNEEVFMTTRLQALRTRFLPFNLDSENPTNPNGHKTHYLWEDIWQPTTLLELIRNYLHIQQHSEKVFSKNKGLRERTSETFIFPRFHQLDVVRKLLVAVRADGVGTNYLVQHSAGSGKSNSIAWLAHQLAGFYQHPCDTERLFDSIIVVTDRRVLDRQLQDTIKQFEQTPGVVKKIDKHSDQLREALQQGKAIIITTLQKFPVISESMTHLKGHRFAVIVDEAHSSQSGESAKHLKQTLSCNLDEAEQQDQVGPDLEDRILQEIHTRGPQQHVSYFAFTATPKNKTLELFGTANEDGGMRSFHSYSMRQAIEEGFILDVLKNYTTFKRYFKLIKTIEVDDEYEKKKAVRLLTSHVDLQPHAIEMKTRIMLDHFLDKTSNRIQGRGRAMLITRSRLHAVRYYQMFQKILSEKQLTLKALVSFSGEVTDPDSGAKFRENSLNRLAPKVTIPDAFKTPDYRLLIVANKYQTGFDEPLLHTMYVDKKLAGVQAVQALSRLNRAHRGKEDPLVLDFVNEPEDIQFAFQPYYQTTMLEDQTDPNRLYDLETELKTFEIFSDTDLEEFARIFFDDSFPLEKLQPILDRVVQAWYYKQENEREDFRSILQSFNRMYGFISQIITFADVDLEKLYVFSRALNRKLPRRENRLPHEILDAIDLESLRIQEIHSGSIELETQNGGLSGIGNGLGTRAEEEKDLLSNIIKTLNDTYGINLSDEDKVDLQNIRTKLEQNEDWQATLQADNTREAIRYKFDSILDKLLLDFVGTKLDLYKKLTEPGVNELFKQRWFDGCMKEYSSGP